MYRFQATWANLAARVYVPCDKEEGKLAGGLLLDKKPNLQRGCNIWIPFQESATRVRRVSTF